jgi:apolipoprotein D and lipocalin family protein
MKNTLAIILMVQMMMFSCSKSQPLATVPYVDPTKYAGLWYEIASFPQSFQKGCHCTTAEYGLTGKGFLTVVNRCNKDSVNGRLSSVSGKAFIEPNSGNAKLKVQFFWPFRGKYWIIALAPDYAWAVVGHPNREYLWILSRTPQLDADIYNGIIIDIQQKGFDSSKLQKTVQKN